MTETTQAPVTAREIAVPPSVQTLSALTRIDYQNAVIAEFPEAGRRTAEQWQREIAEGAPAEMREALVKGWSSVLGLRLGPLDSDEHILGWPIRHSTPDEIVVATGSDAGLHGELVIQRGPGYVVSASFIRLDTDAVRTLWNSVMFQHTPAMCQILADAVNRVRA